MRHLLFNKEIFSSAKSRFQECKVLVVATLFISLQITGCGDSNKPESALTEAIVLSAELMKIYEQSCKNCHTIEATGAPLTGDTKSWNKILSQGIETVVDKAMSGVGGMPPAGQCFECSPDQIKELILYMANPASH